MSQKAILYMPLHIHGKNCSNETLSGIIPREGLEAVKVCIETGMPLIPSAKNALDYC
jgi:hypothetical protein